MATGTMPRVMFFFASSHRISGISRIAISPFVIQDEDAIELDLAMESNQCD